MIGGLLSGMLADHQVRIGYLTVSGYILTMIGVAIMVTFDETTTVLTIGGILFLAGFGIGIFNSPNWMANILAEDERGVAAAVAMITISTLAIVLTIFTCFG